MTLVYCTRTVLVQYDLGVLIKQATIVVMIKKATSKQSKARNSGIKSFAGRYGVVLLIGFLLLAISGAYGYNKYLDQKNVSDMKQLLADFEKLEKDVEAETGEELFIGVSCGDLEEKFTKTPSCYVYLESPRDKPYELSQTLTTKLPERLINNKSCGNFEGTGFIFSNSKKVIYSCYPVVTRASSKADIDKLTSTYTEL